MHKNILVLSAILLIIPTSFLFARDQLFLQRNSPYISPKPDDLTEGTKTATYQPILGIGDKDADKLRGIARYGVLTVDPGGTSAVVSYSAEEQIYFILEGDGTLLYDSQKVPVKQNDFMYLPVGVKHGISNSSNQPVRLLVMGYRIPPGTKVKQTPKLMIANTNDVGLHTGQGHPPSSLFKFLMSRIGTKRGDGNVHAIEALHQVSELFLIDFAPGGTNKPHQHPREEEIYYVLQGKGIMVAGIDANGNDCRHPCIKGDVYYFAPGTRVGFFGYAEEGDAHDQILAVRSIDPTTSPIQQTKPRQ
jgi:mannose-6-phosphate isomerase-like protein (cupin superfamily)